MQQLVAVMFTDIVGYTSVTDDDEALAVKWKTKHRDTVVETIAKYEGVLQDLMGDGSLSYFTSASDCVHCAVAIQLTLMAEPPVPVRIGIHIGEIKGENNLIHGIPINVASRIESIAIGGSILVSRNVIDSISGKSDFSFVSLGPFSFKHVDNPIEIFAVSNPGLRVPDRDFVYGKLKIQERRDIIVFDEWDEEEIASKLATATLICQQAVCSYGFISHNYSKLRAFLKAGGKFQCIFIHPQSAALPVAPERQSGAAQNIAYIQGQLHLAYHKLQSLSTGVTFKLTQHMPEPIMTFIDPESEDGVLFITLSGFRMDLHSRPSFILRKSTHSKWFNFYYQSFLNLMKSEASRTVDFTKSWEENVSMKG